MLGRSALLAATNSSTPGFGAAYADPAVSPPFNSFGVAFSPAGDAIAVVHSNNPWITAYQWSDTSGFGAAYARPTSLPAPSSGVGQANSVTFSPTGNTIVVGHSNNSDGFSITAYPWSAASGFGVRYPNPATFISGIGSGVAFSPAGDVIALGHGGSPFISVYPWSASGFGAKYANPATLPGRNCFSVAFSPAGDAIAVGMRDSPFIGVYPWSAASGFGARYANPATTPSGRGYGVAFSPAGDAIAVAHEYNPVVAAYPWSAGSGFGVKYADPSAGISGPGAISGNSVAFSPDGNAIATAWNTGFYLAAWSWSAASGFGVRYPNPGILPNGVATGVAFSPTGNAIAVAFSVSPFIRAYRFNS